MKQSVGVENGPQLLFIKLLKEIDNSTVFYLISSRTNKIHLTEWIYSIVLCMIYFNLILILSACIHQ